MHGLFLIINQIMQQADVDTYVQENFDKRDNL
jgi:hypothetical protein